jgi:hypothetical protein
MISETLSHPPADIVHDAEHYVLTAQHGEQWAAEDELIDQKLAALREKFGRPPNIIHIMWDDTAFGDVGIPELQKVRGLSTPNINKMAEDGILFTRMYTEVGCTPSRAASATGRHPIRDGKGDFTEGGVRVPAIAWWPGVIAPGQIVGDSIHEVAPNSVEAHGIPGAGHDGLYPGGPGAGQPANRPLQAALRPAGVHRAFGPVAVRSGHGPGRRPMTW